MMVNARVSTKEPIKFANPISGMVHLYLLKGGQFHQVVTSAGIFCHSTFFWPKSQKVLARDTSDSGCSRFEYPRP